MRSRSHSEVTARGVPRKNDVSRRMSVSQEPLVSAGSVFELGGMRVLRGQPIVHQDNRAAGSVRQRAAQGVKVVDGTEYPAATVIIDDYPLRFVARNE